MHSHFRSGRTYQVVEHALVQLPFVLAALPELVVVVVEALPVLAELVKAVLVDIVNPKRQFDVSVHVLYAL